MPDGTIDRVYRYIRDYTETHRGLSPSQREIAAGCYINVAYVARYLDILEAQGRLERARGQARSIRLLDEA